MKNEKLEKLYKRVDQCRFCKTEDNKLQHIYGYGVMNSKLMLILVNPTYRNLSSNPEYRGNKFPFIGVRQFWKVLADAGLINKKVAYRLPLRKDWHEKYTEQIKRELIQNELFLTNVVKCCYNHSGYPDSKVVRYQMKILAEEIRIVNPKKIIAFGGLVYKTLTGKNIKLSEYLNDDRKEKVMEIISGLDIITEPCYFPIGRGNPKKAAEIMYEVNLCKNA